MKFLRFVFSLILIVAIAGVVFGVGVILYNTHPEIAFIPGIIDAIFPALSLEPTMDLGGLLCGAGAAFLVLNSIFLILGSKHKLASLRIFLLFVFLIVGFLGASLVLAIFVPDLAFFKDFFQPIFPDNTIMWAILFCLAALLSFIGLWISFSAAHSRKKRVRKNRDLYEMEANGFDYERDGDEISVTKKAGTYIVDMDDFQKLCSMVQKMFNNGYCRILHIDMKNYHFLFKKKEEKDFVSDSPIIDVKHDSEDEGEPYSEKVEVMGTRKVWKEFTVTKEGEITLSNGQKIYRQRGDTFKDQVNEQYVSGYKYVWYQNYWDYIEFYYSENDKTVVAEDGTKMLIKQHLRRETKN